MEPLKPEILRTYHTKQLLKIMRKVCVNQGTIEERYLFECGEDRDLAKLFGVETSKEEYYEKHIVSADVLGHPDWIKSEITIADLKRELSTREHIPNKIEARKIRQDAAKNHPKKGRRDR